jgi:serralysin
MTGRVAIDLNSGAASSLPGGQFVIAAGTVIENAIGGDGDDVLTGNAANNIFRGNRGNDSIDGGAGIDTAVFTGPRSGYTITVGGSTQVASKSGLEGTDTLVNVERLKFSSGNVALDVGATQSAGQTQLLLGAVLGKDLLATKKPLIGDVIDLFDSGLYSLPVLSGALMRLPIWDLLANGGQPGATNTQIASYLLMTVNKVAPDAATLAAAVTSLNSESGVTQGNFLAGLAVSPANQVQVGLVGLALTGLEYGGL